MHLFSQEQPNLAWNELELDYIVEFMCSSDYPLPKWHKPAAQHCMKLYKRFLWLCKIANNRPMVPTKEIDEFWHNHILYTQNYHSDCMSLFGHYLHHRPSNKENDHQQLMEDFKYTKQLYLATFGEPLEVFKDL